MYHVLIGMHTKQVILLYKVVSRDDAPQMKCSTNRNSGAHILKMYRLEPK